MKSIETKIPQFYDILDEENEMVRRIYDVFLKQARNCGFLEIETTAVELKERYLNATNVHFSKIFSVERAKQKSQYALQADLAMGMSRFIADLPTNEPTIKLMQLGKMYRDRIYNIPGYRREFKQVLLGEWNVPSLFSDAELINLIYRTLRKVDGAEIDHIEISNINIYNVIKDGLAEKIRFNGIEQLSKTSLSDSDKNLLLKLFEKGNVEFSDLEIIGEQLNDLKIKDELRKLNKIGSLLLNIFKIEDKIFFSFNNLEGTGHYSGLHYRIYMKIEDDIFLIGDGGRIDDLCSKFNKGKNVPAICMGIGIQILAQFIKPKHDDRVAILVDESLIEEKWNQITEMKKKLFEFSVSIIPESLSNKRKYFKSEFYSDYTFILIEKDNVTVRSNDISIKRKVLEKIS